jgi:hypothetical protein
MPSPAWPLIYGHHTGPDRGRSIFQGTSFGAIAAIRRCLANDRSRRPTAGRMARQKAGFRSSNTAPERLGWVESGRQPSIIEIDEDRTLFGRSLLFLQQDPSRIHRLATTPIEGIRQGQSLLWRQALRLPNPDYRRARLAAGKP